MRKPKRQNSHTPLLVVFAIAIALATANTAGVFASGGRETSYIEVTATAAVPAREFSAQVELAVETTGIEASEAVSENQIVMDALIDALLEFGIAESEMTTGGFFVFREQIFPGDPRFDRLAATGISTGAGTEEAPVIFRARTWLRTVISDPAEVGEIVDLAVTNGATDVQTMQLEPRNTDELYQRALEAAASAARAKAERTVAADGLSVGRLLALEEQWGRSSGGPFTSMMEFDASGARMLPGTQFVEAGVRARFEVR